MPSPTSSTRPTSRTSACLRMSAISCVRTEAISSALNFITASLDQVLAEVVDARADGGVVEPVADLDHQAAEQGRVLPDVEHRLGVEPVPELPLQLLTLVVGEGGG